MLLQMKSNEKKICCVKCGKTFERTNDLKRHNDRKIACDLYINKTDDAVIQSNFIENSVSHDDIIGLNTKIDALTNTVNHQSQQIGLLLEMMRELKSTHIPTIPTNPTPIPTILTPIPTILTPIPTPILTPIVLQEQIKTNELPIPIVKKIKKVKKQATEATDLPKRKLKYTYPTEATEATEATEKEQEQDALPIHPELKTYLNNLNERFRNSTPPIDLANEQIYYNNDTIFEFNHETEKIVISEDELENFMEKCRTVESQMEWYFQLFKSTLNFTTGFYLDKETNRLYTVGVDKKWNWEESFITNRLRCNIYDTINSAVANSAVVYKTHADRLFVVRRLNYNGDQSDFINERLLEMLKAYYSQKQ